MKGGIPRNKFLVTTLDTQKDTRIYDYGKYKRA